MASKQKSITNTLGLFPAANMAKINRFIEFNACLVLVFLCQLILFSLPVKNEA